MFASGDELVERLDAFLAGQTRPGLHAGESSRARTPKITFVFSGQGPQWWGMGRQLLECNPLFRSVIRKCDAWVRAYGGWSLWDELLRDQQTSRLHETAIAQPAICALQIGLAEVWKSWGIVPDAVVGHSVGEIAAAHVAGALDGEQAIRVIVQRGRCMDRASSRGGMVALGCSLDEAREAIREHSGEITVGAHNSPSSVTLSGDLVALEEIQKVFDGRGYFTKRLPVNYAFHSARMEPARKDLVEALRALEPDQPQIPFVSTVTGQPIDGARLDGEYWWRNIRQPVRFHDAVAWLAANGHDTFVELGPHPILGGSVSETLGEQGAQALVLPTLRREENDQAVMLSSVGALCTRAGAGAAGCSRAGGVRT